MLVKKNTVLLAAIALALTACGSDSTAPVTPTVSSGKAIDGYLSGSTVSCGGATATTNATGDFSFSPACAGAIEVSGGTNVDTGFAFKGKLSAPANSTVVTPLTSLLAGMSASQISTLLSSLGLPTTTNLATTDPVATKNLGLLKATVAVQQILQQFAAAFGTALGSTDLATLYAKSAAALATSLSATSTPLFGSDGLVNVTVLKAAATAAAASAGVTADKLSVANLAAVADQIGAQASSILQAASATDLVNQAKTLQDPAAAPVDTGAGSKFLAFQNDAVEVNGVGSQAGTMISLASFGTGVTVNKLTTIGFEFDVSRVPVLNTTSSIYFELVEPAGKTRKLQVMIDKVNFTLANGQLAIAPATGAKVYVYGHTSNGSDLNLTLSDLSFQPLGVVNNRVRLNFDSIVRKVLASAQNTSQIVAGEFVDITGTFNAKIVVSDLNLRYDADGRVLDTFAVSVNGSSAPTAIVGRGVVGTLTLTQ